MGKNKTFSQLIALNLKCCKINSRVMPNTQAQSFMQTETANVERDSTERESDRERERGRDGAEKSCTLAETETGHGTAELLLKRAGKCTVEKRTKRETERKEERERERGMGAHGYERACGHAQWTRSRSWTCSWTATVATEARAARKCGVDER